MNKISVDNNTSKSTCNLCSHSLKNYYAVAMTIAHKFNPRLSCIFRKHVFLSDNFLVWQFPGTRCNVGQGTKSTRIFYNQYTTLTGNLSLSQQLFSILKQRFGCLVKFCVLKGWWSNVQFMESCFIIYFFCFRVRTTLSTFWVSPPPASSCSGTKTK